MGAVWATPARYGLGAGSGVGTDVGASAGVLVETAVPE